MVEGVKGAGTVEVEELAEMAAMVVEVAQMVETRARATYNCTLCLRQYHNSSGRNIGL